MSRNASLAVLFGLILAATQSAIYGLGYVICAVQTLMGA